VKRSKWIVLILAIPLFVGCFLLFAPDAMIWRGEIARGNRIVLQIESLRRQNGHPPETLSEVRIPEAELDKFFYEKCSDSRYILWFGTKLGESMTYDSSLHSWSGINTTCR